MSETLSRNQSRSLPSLIPFDTTPPLRTVVMTPGKVPLNLHDVFGRRVPNANYFDIYEHDLARAGLAVVQLQVPQVFPVEFAAYEQRLNAVALHKRTILTGHSAGALANLRYVSKHKDIELEKLISIAPSGCKNWPDAERRFADFTLDPDLEQRVGRLIFVHSTTDSLPIRDFAVELREVYPRAEHVVIVDGGHLTHGTTPNGHFPELVAATIASISLH